MAKRYLKRYQELATANGMSDPLAYLFKRYKGHILNGDQGKAEELAKFLMPYGHGKIAQVDQNTGETVQQQLVINHHPDADGD